MQQQKGRPRAFRGASSPAACTAVVQHHLESVTGQRSVAPATETASRVLQVRSVDPAAAEIAL